MVKSRKKNYMHSRTLNFRLFPIFQQTSTHLADVEVGEWAEGKPMELYKDSPITFQVPKGKEKLRKGRT